MDYAFTYAEGEKLEAEKDLQVLREEIAELETENSKLRE